MQRVSATAIVRAPAEKIYALLRDYRDGHPRILPPQHFPSLEIETGGIGAGTVLRVEVRLLGQTAKFRMTVTEPEPGRVMVETDVAANTTTTYTVEPGPETGQTRVTIDTEWKLRAGALGALERLFVPNALQGVYADELRRLTALVEG